MQGRHRQCAMLLTKLLSAAGSRAAGGSGLPSCLLAATRRPVEKPTAGGGSGGVRPGGSCVRRWPPAAIHLWFQIKHASLSRPTALHAAVAMAMAGRGRLLATPQLRICHCGLTHGCKLKRMGHRCQRVGIRAGGQGRYRRQHTALVQACTTCSRCRQARPSAFQASRRPALLLAIISCACE